MVCRHDAGNFGPASGMQRAGKSCAEGVRGAGWAVFLRCSAGTGSGADRRAGTGAGARSNARIVRIAAACVACRNRHVRCRRRLRNLRYARAGHFLCPYDGEKRRQRVGRKAGAGQGDAGACEKPFGDAFRKIFRIRSEAVACRMQTGGRSAVRAGGSGAFVRRKTDGEKAGKEPAGL